MSINKVTHIAISSQVLGFHLQQYKATMGGAFKQSFYNVVNKFLRELEVVEKKYFDQFSEKSEEASVVTFDTYDAFLKTVSTIPIWEMANATTVLQKYFDDPKGMEKFLNGELK